MKAKYLFVDVHSLSYIFELKYLEGVHDFLKMINETDSIKLLDYDKIFFVLNGVNPDETRKNKNAPQQIMCWNAKGIANPIIFFIIVF